MQNHCFNILTFEHPQEELTLYFSNEEDEKLTRIFHKLVPDEVIEAFGEQEHYYTSFTKEVDGFYPVTKAVNPSYETKEDENGEERSYFVHNSALSVSILKRYYNYLIHEYFKAQGFLVKPNFISDTEVWLPSKKSDRTGRFNLFDRYSIKVQFKTVTKQLELLVTFEGTSKVYKQSVEVLQESVSPTAFNWVIFDNGLYRFDELPNAGKRAYDQVFPVWNFNTRDALGETTEAPDKSNKYKKFKDAIDFFYNTYLNTEEFKKLIPINSNGFIPVEEIKMGRVKSNSNQLLFGEGNTDIVPMNGMKNHGPFDFSDTSNIHFFSFFIRMM